MERQGTRFNLLILDCCRDNPLPESKRSLGSGGLCQMIAPEGSFVAFACAVKKCAAEDSEKHRNGYYAQYLLKHIETPGLRIDDLFIHVSKEVKAATRHLPQGPQDPWTANNLKIIGASLC